jgi:hypothetical protein
MPSCAVPRGRDKKDNCRFTWGPSVWLADTATGLYCCGIRRDADKQHEDVALVASSVADEASVGIFDGHRGRACAKETSEQVLFSLET